MKEVNNSLSDISKSNTQQQDKQNQETRNIQVLFRVRPLIKTEKQFSWDVDEDSGQIQLIPELQDKYNIQPFKFNKIYGEQSSNYDVFEGSIRPVLPQLLKNCSCTVMCYGQSCSGKTSTMFEGPGGQKGLVQLIVDELFSLIEGTDFIVKLQYLEIYNENLVDLLSPELKQPVLREEGGKMVMSNVTEPRLSSHSELINFIQQGNKRRTVSETNQNEQSSRSHAIIRLILQQGEKLSLPTKKTLKVTSQSAFTLVDLAGSERLQKSSTTGKNLKEGNNINQSLLTLGLVINQLRTKNGFVSYRNSKLTRLLRDSLGGEAATFVVGCISPAASNVAESIATMRFCQRAMDVQNTFSKSLTHSHINTHTNTHTQQELLLQNRALKQRIQELEKQLSLTQSQVLAQSTCSSFISDNGELNINELDQYLAEQQTDVRIDKEIQTELEIQVSIKEIIGEQPVIPKGVKLINNNEFEQLKSEYEYLSDQCVQLQKENDDLKKKNADNDINFQANTRQTEQLRELQQQQENEKNQMIQKLQAVEESLQDKNEQVTALEQEKIHLQNELEELIKQITDNSQEQVQNQQKIQEYKEQLANKQKEHDEVLAQAKQTKNQLDSELQNAQQYIQNMQQHIYSMENELNDKKDQEAFFTQLLEETEASQKALQQQLKEKEELNQNINNQFINIQNKYEQLQEVLFSKEKELEQQIQQQYRQQQTVNDDIVIMMQEQERKQQEIIQLKEQAIAYEEQIAKYNTTILTQEEQLTNFQTDLQNKQEKLDNLQTILNRLQNEIITKQQNIVEKSVQLTQILTSSKALETSHAQLFNKCLQNSVIYGYDVSIQKSMIKQNKNVNTSQQQICDCNGDNDQETGTLSKIESAKISLKSQFSIVNEVGEALSIRNQSQNNSVNRSKQNSGLKHSPLQQVFVQTAGDEFQLDESTLKDKLSQSLNATIINGFTTKVKESLTIKDLTRSNSGASQSLSKTHQVQIDNERQSSGTFVLSLNSNDPAQQDASTTNITANTTQISKDNISSKNICDTTVLFCDKSTIVQDRTQNVSGISKASINKNKHADMQTSHILKTDAYVQKSQIQQQDIGIQGIDQEEKCSQRTPTAHITVSIQTINQFKEKEQHMTPKILLPDEVQTDPINCQNETQTSPKINDNNISIKIQTSPLNKEGYNQVTPLVIDQIDASIQLQFTNEIEIQTDDIKKEIQDMYTQKQIEIAEGNTQVTPKVIQSQKTEITPIVFQDNQVQCDQSQCLEEDIQTEDIELKEFDFPIDQQLKDVLTEISSNLSTLSTKAKRPGVLKGKQQQVQQVNSYNFAQLIRTLNKLIDKFVMEQEQKENQRIQAENYQIMNQMSEEMTQLRNENEKLRKKNELYEQEIENIHISYKEQLKLKDNINQQQQMQLQSHNDANYKLSISMDMVMRKLQQEEEKTQRLQESALEEQLEMTQKILSITNGHSEHDSSETELVTSSVPASQQQENLPDYKKMYEETEAKFNRLLQQSRDTIQKVMTVAKERETNLQRKAAEQVQNMQKYKEIVMKMQMRAKQQQQTMQFQQQLINEQIKKHSVNEIAPP